MPTCLNCKREYEQSEWASTRVREPKFCSPSCKGSYHYFKNKAKREAAKLQLVFDREQPELDLRERRYAVR
jgi:hypothetical protein